MSSVGELIVDVSVDTHGGLDDTRVGVVRRTLALWLLTAVARLLRTRLDVELKERR